MWVLLIFLRVNFWRRWDKRLLYFHILLKFVFFIFDSTEFISKILALVFILASKITINLSFTLNWILFLIHIRWRQYYLLYRLDILLDYSRFDQSCIRIFNAHRLIQIVVIFLLLPYFLTMIRFFLFFFLHLIWLLVDDLGFIDLTELFLFNYLVILNLVLFDGRLSVLIGCWMISFSDGFKLSYSGELIIFSSTLSLSNS